MGNEIDVFILRKILQLAEEEIKSLGVSNKAKDSAIDEIIL